MKIMAEARRKNRILTEEAKKRNRRVTEQEIDRQEELTCSCEIKGERQMQSLLLG